MSISKFMFLICIPNVASKNAPIIFKKNGIMHFVAYICSLDPFNGIVINDYRYNVSQQNEVYQANQHSESHTWRSQQDLLLSLILIPSVSELLRLQYYTQLKIRHLDTYILRNYNALLVAENKKIYFLIENLFSITTNYFIMAMTNNYYKRFQATIEHKDSAKPHNNCKFYNLYILIQKIFYNNYNENDHTNERSMHLQWSRGKINYYNHIFCLSEGKIIDTVILKYISTLLPKEIPNKGTVLECFDNKNLFTYGIEEGYHFKDLSVYEWKNSFYLGNNLFFKVIWLINIENRIVGLIFILKNTFL